MQLGIAREHRSPEREHVLLDARDRTEPVQASRSREGTAQCGLHEAGAQRPEGVVDAPCPAAHRNHVGRVMGRGHRLRHVSDEPVGNARELGGRRPAELRPPADDEIAPAHDGGERGDPIGHELASRA